MSRSLGKRVVFFSLLLMGLGLTFAAAVAAEEFRTWTDSTGKFSLRAKLDSVEGEKVILLRENGQRMTIPMKKLSRADLEFLAQRKTDNPFQPVEDSFFTPAGPAREVAVAGPRLVKVDWTRSQQVLLQAGDAEWRVTVPPVPASNFRPRSVPLPGKTDFFEGLCGLAINPVAKKAVVGYKLDKHGREESTSRIVICDLEQGRSMASTPTEGLLAPLALHDDGRHVLMRRDEFGFGNLDRLEIWSLQGKNVVRSLVWTPYADAQHGARDVMWAEFINADTLATSSRGGKVALWNVATAEPICHFQLDDGAIPALSPDRKWIAFCSNDTVGLFDVEKREVIATRQTPRRLQWPALAFSPSGRKIGCTAFDRILVWDTASGKLEKDFATPGIHIHGAVDFPDDGFILAVNQYLIELDRQLKLWHYQGAEAAHTAGGMTFLATTGDQRGGLLMAAKLPHPQATALLKKALNQPDLFVFHQGTPVQLDVNGIPPDRQTRVTEALTKKLKALKCPVEAAAPVVVAASVEGPKQREISYMHSGTYQVQEYVTRLKINYQGKTIWENQSTNIPGFVHLKEGENMESHLREASQEPAYGFYDNITLPEFLQKPSDDQRPGGGQTLGASRVTPQGLR
ncbi:MAG: hypothetical protein JXB10_15865 [Pirellulales bacterium]|nr:hypothetical protein [Pirellulales bacterium]